MTDRSDSNPLAHGAKQRTYTRAELARFIIPTILGILLFLTPISVDGRLTVMIAFIIDYVNDVIKPMMVPVAVAVAVIPAVFTIVVSSSSLKKNPTDSYNYSIPG